MSRPGIVFAALASTTLFSHTAYAQPQPAEPQYLGDRSNNPEQETFASVLPEVGGFILAFTGPARMVGTVTGDPEKDTVAYKPFLAMRTVAERNLANFGPHCGAPAPRDGRWSYGIDD
jgi:hypothetical protein